MRSASSAKAVFWTLHRLDTSQSAGKQSETLQKATTSGDSSPARPCQGQRQEEAQGRSQSS